MLGPFTTTSRLTPIQQMSLPVLSHAACTSMSTTTLTMTTTGTRDRGDRYGPIEWSQLIWLLVKTRLRIREALQSYASPLLLIDNI